MPLIDARRQPAMRSMLRPWRGRPSRRIRRSLALGLASSRRNEWRVADKMRPRCGLKERSSERDGSGGGVGTGGIAAIHRPDAAHAGRSSRLSKAAARKLKVKKAGRKAGAGAVAEGGAMCATSDLAVAKGVAVDDDGVTVSTHAIYHLLVMTSWTVVTDCCVHVCRRRRRRRRRRPG